MTLDEAIKHCEEVAEKQDKLCEISVTERAKEQNSKCAEEHQQLAEWLKELKEYREQRDGRMNEAEKERLIKKDIESIENRVRHAFNQGYEMGLKESSSEIPNTCGDAISRQAVDDAIYDYSRSCNVDYSQIMEYIEKLPSVTPQQRIGHWIDIMVGDMPAQACDQCNTFYPLAYTGGGHKYCPNCGCKMEVEE